MKISELKNLIGLHKKERQQIRDFIARLFPNKPSPVINELENYVSQYDNETEIIGPEQYHLLLLLNNASRSKQTKEVDQYLLSEIKLNLWGEGTGLNIFGDLQKLNDNELLNEELFASFVLMIERRYSVDRYVGASNVPLTTLIAFFHKLKEKNLLTPFILNYMVTYPKNVNLLMQVLYIFIKQNVPLTPSLFEYLKDTQFSLNVIFRDIIRWHNEGILNEYGLRLIYKEELFVLEKNKRLNHHSLDEIISVLKHFQKAGLSFADDLEVIENRTKQIEIIDLMQHLLLLGMPKDEMRFKIKNYNDPYRLTAAFNRLREKELLSLHVARLFLAKREPEILLKLLLLLNEANITLHDYVINGIRDFKFHHIDLFTLLDAEKCRGRLTLEKVEFVLKLNAVNSGPFMLFADTYVGTFNQRSENLGKDDQEPTKSRSLSQS